MPLDVDNCPNCGTSMRGLAGPIAAIVLGLVVVIGSLGNIDDLWFYALIGVALIGVGSALIYDRRRRTREV